MRQYQSSGSLTIIFTFFLAAILEVVTLPQEVMLGRPMWLASALIFWVIALPNRIGVYSGFVVGLFADLLLGRVFGVYAISFAVLAFLALHSHKRLRAYLPLQQSLAVFLLLGVTAILQHLLNSMLGNVKVSTLYILIPAIVSAIIWRPVLLILRWFQLRFMVR